MDWYIVNTFSGYENSVKKSLEERIEKAGLQEMFGEILVPSEKTVERKGKRTITVTKKFFPGYIFVQMQLQDVARSLVKNTPKVSGFLGGQNPKPVTQIEMDKMLGRAAPAQAPVADLPDVIYRVGEHVRVRSGAFANFSGEVEEVNQDKRKIWLSVSIFGRPTRVEVDFSEVELAAAG